MNLKGLFKRGILFGAIVVIIVSVFLVVEKANKSDEGNIGENNGTTSPVDLVHSKDNEKNHAPVEDDQKDSEEKEQKTPPQKDRKDPAEDPEEKDRPKVAIIIDDLGYNPDLDEELYQLDQPLTVAVMPFRSHTRETAEKFSGKDNFELLLHLPLEPMDEKHKEEEMATVDMSRGEIASFLDDSLEEVEGVEGINNHKGSRFTSNETKMGYLLEEIRQRDLFFVDSYTLGDSVGYSLASEMGVPTARRDVFLDYDDDKQVIIDKLRQLEEVARENGTAIGIGHHRENTIEALKEELPRMEERGVELVVVSEVLE